MQASTLDYIFHNCAVMAPCDDKDSRSNDTIDALVYRCRMLWLCRSDKLHKEEILHLVDLSNSAFQCHLKERSLPVLPDDVSAYRYGNEPFYAGVVSYSELETAVRQYLNSHVLPRKAIEQTSQPGSSLWCKLKSTIRRFLKGAH